MSSKFVEILEDDGETVAQRKMCDSDVKLEDVLADHEATVNRSRSSTQSSSKSQESPPWSRDGQDSNASSTSTSSSTSSNTSPTSPLPKIKRLRKFTLTGGFSR
ncbi:hypothetical protein BGW36DRAFT_188830 [Talaromyces proteolyticus]|uniref:Uncharacterized protein n=1 Tax=Talaromyces proteolyticus TaxID=1131652 RepID=A0AAD4PVI9_9EURO|nr:uncharacterized protein BGW36DRAFT_188830 [Talaromyces proteolyticus]KAH8696575.1 hypothetical protein BGW36DRAFT_188830 [Talaromyces proteolyticus]